MSAPTPGFLCASPHCPGEHTSPYYRCNDDGGEGYPGIAHDYETVKAKLAGALIDRDATAAERDRLRETLATLNTECERLTIRDQSVSEDNDRLRAENEQLRDYGIKRDGELAFAQQQNAELREALAQLARRELGVTALGELIARYERAELSEGQLCKLLGLDRVETRALVDASRSALRASASGEVV